ncbi:transcription elongation factor GreA [Actinotignum urinale]|uniref:Transcription elongation factor GreA n=1 Tax=Actinotignum urinale TaxID=190146 RepID=A0AAW9HR59_9ACTO|nr:transcription elongation factor GreA [Actinotignum urinale]MDY5151907.1 transcription elongation factor GreA [Actinotignum urinale]MDY5154183.1 transcription elongation factor GreA [Actinotignum urinale]MDY5159726.1 transcription elongation factor GreA [Actinotignum urinale]WIK58505.1 transcription elongation factor GreA [Actinotignum urinale]
MAEEKKTWLSPETYEKLRGELEHMKTVQREDIRKKIEQARSEGDLRENGGYHAAREEQSKLEGRILELTHLLENADVSAPPKGDVVASGCVITAKIRGVEETFLLGAREASNLVDLEIYPESAPLGVAIMGLKKGDTTTFKNRMGRPVKVEIIDIKPFEG